MKPWSVLFLLLASTAPLLANGGGYLRGGITHAGDLTAFEPQATGSIRMTDEKLTIAFGKKEAQVEIHYLLRNQTRDKVKVRFGFPVEEVFDNDMINEERTADPEGTKAQVTPKYCQDYVITARGKDIAAKWQGEKKPSQDEQLKGIAGWLVSEISFAPGQEIPVTIRFRSGYVSEAWGVSDDSRKSPSIFKYRLSTAAVWAGTIGTGKITLKPDGIPAGDLKVLKPANRFKKDGDTWVWEFKDLEPTLADDFEVEATPEERSYMRSAANPAKSDGPFADYIQRAEKWSMAHTNYTITASSTLAADGDTNYSADNLKNIWSEDAWSEGAKGAGIGEWLEVKPRVAKPLTAISIVPGYAKSDLFKANARPRKILVELNGEHRFNVEIPDSPELFEFPVIGYNKPVNTVKLTFQDVWKGSRHEDLCVTGLRLHVPLDKAPKIQPAR
ncbi:MAG: hypothetical protein EOP87_04610 [Verrucomicrobiaceae bacterium]|nr:MAG: hypothetical protein EOP87_04610 [Verrucomicrobiaceae bacterium]